MRRFSFRFMELIPMPIPHSDLTGPANRDKPVCTGNRIMIKNRQGTMRSLTVIG